MYMKMQSIFEVVPVMGIKQKTQGVNLRVNMAEKIGAGKRKWN